jgi:rubrerythrin
VVAKFGVPDFASREVQKETDEELTAIMTKGENKMPSYEKTLKKSQMEEFVACMGELGDREQGRQRIRVFRC